MKGSQLLPTSSSSEEEEIKEEFYCMQIAQQKIFEILKKVEKPGRYLGNEVNACHKDLSQVDLKIALIMPETYEIAQSNLGLQILYEVANKIPNVVAERVYAPWVDLEKVLREEKVPLFSLESKIPLSEFDIIGISLPYELSYTNILTMFDLASIPRWAKDRNSLFPLIIGGGNQSFNPEPIADFFDAFVVGDGEEALVEIIGKILKWKEGVIASPAKQGAAISRVYSRDRHVTEAPRDDKCDLLRELSSIRGVYVPSFFDIKYKEDHTIAAIQPLYPDYKEIRKAIVKDLNEALFPVSPVVPAIKTIHDRLAVEVQRGCVRSCRFCQAGYIYRPERQRSPEKVLELIDEAMGKTGSEEISLLSLSVGDYGCLVPLVKELFDRYEKKKVSISLPATRTDTFSPEVIQQVKRVRKTGFTIAPEAGTPRMRRVINKGNSREDLYKTVENIFSEDWQLIKFYYMCGLPFETEEDLAGIVEEGHGALQIGRKYSRRVAINLNVSPHVPKPFTPFQWEAQDSIETTRKKIYFLKDRIRDRGIHFKYHDFEQSYLEGVFARGDRRLAKAIERAWELGCRFDGWDEFFDLKKWKQAFEETGIDPDFYVTRERSKEEILPWDHLFVDLKKEFLWQERERSRQEAFTHDCSVDKCTVCGICDYKKIQDINYKINPENGATLRYTTRGRKLSELDELVRQPWRKKQDSSLRATERSAAIPGVQSRDHQAGFQPPRDDIQLGEKNLTEESRENSATSFSKVFTVHRCQFTKTGEAAFLSHLEIMGVLKRALSRTGVKLRFSEGYHPQPKLALGQPTPTGVESLSEYFDIEIEGELDFDFVSRMNQTLPRGLEVLNAVKLQTGTPSISASMVGIVWKVDLGYCYPGGREALEERLRWMKSQSQLFVTRRREKGSKEVDIRPYLDSVELLSEDCLSIVTKVSPQGSARPQEILQHLLEKPEEKMMKRIRVTKLNSLHQ